jgi:hypothetical protein
MEICENAFNWLNVTSILVIIFLSRAAMLGPTKYLLNLDTYSATGLHNDKAATESESFFAFWNMVNVELETCSATDSTSHLYIIFKHMYTFTFCQRT